MLGAMVPVPGAGEACFLSANKLLDSGSGAIMISEALVERIQAEIPEVKMMCRSRGGDMDNDKIGIERSSWRHEGRKCLFCLQTKYKRGWQCCAQTCNVESLTLSRRSVLSSCMER